MNAQKYPIGIQSFPRVREEGFVYVDKTAYIQKMVSNSGFYFLSRPRRFGKSLLISTVEAFFQGRRELFDGLSIADYDHDWAPRVVFHIDMTGRVYDSPEALGKQLGEYFECWEAEYGDRKADRDLSERFRYIIEQAFVKSGRKVVVLVDEYDKPLLDSVHLPEVQDRFRDVLKAVYSNLKRMGDYIEFALLTGVTRFGKLSIFSDLNNLNDISLYPQFAGICGITEQELTEYFGPGIEALAEVRGCSFEEALKLLKRNYDGYHFATAAPDTYNPFSVLNCLYSGEIRNYWFSTGTPSFLVRMIKEGQLPLSRLSDAEVSLNKLGSVSFTLGDLVPVLYQSGYLTIKSVNPRFENIVRLGFPNLEVEQGFLDELLSIYTPVSREDSEFEISKFVTDLEDGRPEAFMRRLNSLFAGYQYDQMDLGNLELHYRNVIYLLCKLMGFYTRAELRTASGRIDLAVETGSYIYLFEFKLDRSVSEAMAQIADRDYPRPFIAGGRKIFKIAANFSSKTRSINDFLIE